jgi:hypothetical protein
LLAPIHNYRHPIIPDIEHLTAAQAALQESKYGLAQFLTFESKHPGYLWDMSTQQLGTGALPSHPIMQKVITHNVTYW